MKSLFMVFLFSVFFACGRVDLVSPSTPSQAPDTATSTGTGVATAAAAAPAPAPAPAVVVNNTINNTQNGAPAPAAAPAPTSHPGLIAKGDTEAAVETILGLPANVAICGRDTTGWWYENTYCVGFANGTADYQYNVPAAKLYLPSW